MAESASDLCGQVLAGKYRVDRVLGAGGMGVVVEAHHLALDSKVAIKFLTDEVQGNEQAVARFAREARVAAKIRSEHVTRVLDVGTLENGAHYIVMELLDGVDLRQWLARKGPLPVGEAVDFVLQASEAIAEAHDLGIVHRDLKPANLFCVRRPNGSNCIKVLDFGISKMATLGDSGSSLSMTGTATMMGTPFYMSPEQMESARNTDGRTDIWALGVILFELLTGQTPFGGESLPQVCLSVTSRPAPSVRALRPEVPPPVEAAIHKCLEKDRTKRYPTVGELCDALAPFAAVPESRARGYEAGRFSFNVKGGRCEACQGDGVIKVEMHFLADVYVPCDVCKGKRYNRETLEIRFKGKNVQEVLDLTVEDALPFFSAVPTVQPKLQTLLDVGLSYVRLGQSATTLSGGEAQRVKLAKELSKRATGRTLYILDEPTTGLHFADIAQLLVVLQRLRDEGNTVIVIEHNLDVIKTADWVVDLGPEGGDGGGRIIAVGTPEQIAANKASYTGRYLRSKLAAQPTLRKRA